MALAQPARLFALSELAACVGKDIATVRKWFEGLPGVRKYPRGSSNQKPSLGIPEAVARKKLKEIGLSDEEINGLLIEPHDRRRQEEERKPSLAERTPAKRKPKLEPAGRKPRK